MSRSISLLALLLTFSSCVQPSEPPTPPTPPVAPVVAPAPAPDIPPDPPLMLDFTLGAHPYSPVTAEAPRAEAPKLEPERLETRKRSAKTQSPAQLIEEANKTARLSPSPRGYFGGGGTHRYQWTPGRIYEV
jgi:hypothetical protein